MITLLSITTWHIYMQMKLLFQDGKFTLYNCEIQYYIDNLLHLLSSWNDTMQFPNDMHE